DHRGGTHKLDHEITIADGIQTICRDCVKAESLRDAVPIDRKGCARECRRTERHNVYALANFAEALAVASQHFEVSETPVREQNRLCTLQMGVAGNRDFTICVREIEQCLLRVTQQTPERINFVTQP